MADHNHQSTPPHDGKSTNAASMALDNHNDALPAHNPNQGQQNLKHKKSAGLLRRFTKKLKPPPLNTAIRPGPPSSLSPLGAVSPRSLKNPPPLPNDFTSKERRQAALRERGLIPAPPKDLSRLESELDHRLAKVVPPPGPSADGQSSAAELIRREWKAKNESASAADDGGSASSAPLYPDSLGKPDFSRPHLTLRIEEDDDSEDGLIVITSSHCPATTPTYHSAKSNRQLSEQVQIETNSNAVNLLLDFKDLPALPPLLSPTDIPVSVQKSPDQSRSLPFTSSPEQPMLQFVEDSDGSRSHSDPNIVRGRLDQSWQNWKSMPALSPTKTNSSFSSIATPRDESRERGTSAMSRSYSGRSGRLSTREEPRKGFHSIVTASKPDEIVDQVIPEYPVELSGFETYVEKREKADRRRSTGIFLNKRSVDFTDRRSSILSGNSGKCSAVNPTSPIITLTEPSEGVPKSPSKFSNFRRTMSKRIPPSLRSRSPPPPSLPPKNGDLVRKPTSSTVHNPESMLREVKMIKDEESRRLSEMAFLDF